MDNADKILTDFEHDVLEVFQIAPLDSLDYEMIYGYFQFKNGFMQIMEAVQGLEKVGLLSKTDITPNHYYITPEGKRWLEHHQRKVMQEKEIRNRNLLDLIASLFIPVFSGVATAVILHIFHL